MFDVISDYYRCAEGILDFDLAGELSTETGYFRLGPELLCYGRNSAGRTTAASTGEMTDVAGVFRTEGQRCLVPFAPDEVVNNLRCERYVNDRPEALQHRLIRDAYYCVRPFLPVGIRKHLQRTSLRARSVQQFPRWPVDATADMIIRRLAAAALEAARATYLPFVWFWPDGKSCGAIMTHDVETAAGRDFCSTLMDIDDRLGIKSSFQVVPEKRYSVSPAFLNSIRNRGFEINVHDLNHDGLLFRSYEEFQRRAPRINSYLQEFGATGYRSAVLYRNLAWYDAFSCSYDMSVPNVGRLDPQPGGCCTVMPYFIGDILELPLTMTQDYSLFNILNTHSLDLWRQQIGLVRESNGLISFNVHPDYLDTQAARNTYDALLQHLADLRSEAAVWIALPGDVDRWWRQRSQMKVVRRGGSWQIEGAGSERARIAHATFADGKLTYSIQEQADATDDVN